MRIRLNFVLHKKELHIEYRKSIISFIKKSLSDVNDKYYEQFYSNKKQKPYTWSSYFDIESISDKFYLKNNNLYINFSVDDTKLGYLFINMFLNQRKKSFKLSDDNFMTLISVNEKNENIIRQNNIICKTLSPLVVIKQDEKYNYKTNYFLNYEDTDFSEVFKEKTNCEIVPIQCKKQIVQHYNIKFPVTTGIFLIKGDIKDLQKLYNGGICDKHSQGFGMIEILK